MPWQQHNNLNIDQQSIHFQSSIASVVQYNHVKMPKKWNMIQNIQKYLLWCRNNFIAIHHLHLVVTGVPWNYHIVYLNIFECVQKKIFHNHVLHSQQTHNFTPFELLSKFWIYEYSIKIQNHVKMWEINKILQFEYMSFFIQLWWKFVSFSWRSDIILVQGGWFARECRIT